MVFFFKFSRLFLYFFFFFDAEINGYIGYANEK